MGACGVERVAVNWLLDDPDVLMRPARWPVAYRMEQPTYMMARYLSTCVMEKPSRMGCEAKVESNQRRDWILARTCAGKQADWRCVCVNRANKKEIDVYSGWSSSESNPKKPGSQLSFSEFCVTMSVSWHRYLVSRLQVHFHGYTSHVVWSSSYISLQLKCYLMLLILIS